LLKTSSTPNPFQERTPVANITGVQSAEDPQSKRANYFGISGTSRYYASFYASVGAEFIFKKKYQLIVEPLYTVSLKTIGYQEKRLHTFGLSLGFKYDFGKK